VELHARTCATDGVDVAAVQSAMPDNTVAGRHHGLKVLSRAAGEVGGPPAWSMLPPVRARRGNDDGVGDRTWGRGQQLRCPAAPSWARGRGGGTAIRRDDGGGGKGDTGWAGKASRRGVVDRFSGRTGVVQKLKATVSLILCCLRGLEYRKPTRPSRFTDPSLKCTKSSRVTMPSPLQSVMQARTRTSCSVKLSSKASSSAARTRFRSTAPSSLGSSHCEEDDITSDRT